MARQLKKASVKEVVKINKVKKPEVVAAVTAPHQKGTYVFAVGRRKTATARIRLYAGRGESHVNEKQLQAYFTMVPMMDVLLDRPFAATQTSGKYYISAKVNGSGVHAQFEAMLHGVARALVKVDPTFKPLLKKTGLLTRDPRMKETRKIGKGGKARRGKQSPKR